MIWKALSTTSETSDPRAYSGIYKGGLSFKSSTYHTSKESKCLQILEDIAGLSCDKEHIHSFQWLVYVANWISLHEGMLLAYWMQNENMVQDWRSKIMESKI